MIFLKSLDEQGITPDRVAGVMTETYQGGNSSFAPPDYVQKLRAWCDEHGVLLIFDEVQAGFGRTGTYWGFEHYGVVPDLIVCGKGNNGGDGYVAATYLVGRGAKVTVQQLAAPDPATPAGRAAGNSRKARS